MNYKKIAIIGKENTGKSTLFNTITNTREAITSHVSGLTRDRRYGSFQINQSSYVLIDTGGITEPNTAFYSEQVNEQVSYAVKEAELIYVVMNSEWDASPQELDFIRTLRKKNKLFCIVASKADKVSKFSIWDRNYAKLGVDVFPVSSLYNTGLHELMTFTTQTLIDSSNSSLEQEDDKEYIICTIIGRPNVGKSTLINTVLGENRLVTSDHPGTTTDSIKVPVFYNGNKYLLIDTAGVRRKAKVKVDNELLSVVRALEMICDTQLVVVIVDGTEELTHQDLYLLQHCFTVRKKTVIIAVNKADLLSSEQKLKMKLDLTQRFPKLYESCIHYISAKSGKGVKKLMCNIATQYNNMNLKIKNHALSHFLTKKLVNSKNNFRFKIKFAHIGGYDPLRIILHGSRMEYITKEQKLFLENSCRSFLKLSNTPIKVIIKQEKDE